MAKVNVHSAGRDELVEAGVRAEVADEILKLRRKGRIENAEALAELPGVGPATVEQLKKALDFSEPRERERERESERAGSGNAGGNARRERDEGERETRETARRAEEIAQSTVKAASEAGQRGLEAAEGTARATSEAARRGVEAGVETAASVARSGFQVVQRATDEAGEVQRAVAQRSTEGAAELGRAFIDLIGEQTQHNVRVVNALTRTLRWDELLKIQGEYVQASFERLARLTQRYLELTQAAMVAVQQEQGGGRRRREDRAA